MLYCKILQRCEAILNLDSLFFMAQHWPGEWWWQNLRIYYIYFFSSQFSSFQVDPQLRQKCLYRTLHCIYIIKPLVCLFVCLLCVCPSALSTSVGRFQKCLYLWSSHGTGKVRKIFWGQSEHK